MSKCKSESCSAATNPPPAKRQQQQHLYLVLDDWEDGYSVHKVDVSAFDPDSAAAAHEDLQEPKPFAEPPVARFGAVHGNSHAFLAHGTKIIAMKPPDINPAIPAFDTATSALVTLPWPSFRMNYGRPILVSIAGKIFLFINDTHYLGDPPPPPPPRRINGGGHLYQPRVQEPWVWTAVGTPQARLPFTAGSSYCHALHPYGRTLVVSASKWAHELKEGTFSFDTDRLEWTCHDSWKLPFSGRAYYLAELDAWVGLCRHKGGTGHLCSSDVLPVGAVHGNSHAFLAHGTKIIAMKPPDINPAIPAFDTATSALVTLPWPSFRMNYGRPILVSIAGKIFLFINDTHYLGDPPPPPLPRRINGGGHLYQPRVQEPWVWTAVGTPQACLPFTAGSSYCHALHPYGRTLVVSASKWAHELKEGTFSFDTDRLEWTCHGSWKLPFSGRAYYLAELDAWVGLCRHKGGTGHLCSSDVLPVGAVHGNSHAFLAHGTKIIAMKPPDINPAIPAFDTATSALVTLPWPSFRMNYGRPILVSIAGKIFLFINDTHYLGDPPPPSPPRRINGGGHLYQPRVQEPWVWTAVGTPQARLPFTAGSSYCHALHPYGRTLVVSASKWAHELKEGTFSFDTDRLEWTCHGSWKLPFSGRAYYLAELDTWVGLCRHKGGTGHLCSSDVLPVGAVHGNSHAFLAHGTKIIAMKPPDINPAIPAFDTATSALVTLPWPSFRMNYGRPILVSIAGKIFLFINDTHYLGDPPPPPPPRRINGGGHLYQPRVQEPWVWTAVGTPQARLPFTAGSSYCHALHPYGRTLVVSASKWAHELKEGTFSFDTDRLEWTCHGSWKLPFSGRAYYLAELDAWVGLCRHKGGTGHLCSSDVLPVGAGGPTTLPRWKLGDERLFDRESPLHLGARLVHMGGTRFCLVEYTWHEDDDDIRRTGEHTGLYVGPPRVVVRMTTFGVKHGGEDDGELRLEAARARSCNIFRRPHGFQDTRPVAFWI